MASQVLEAELIEPVDINLGDNSSNLALGGTIAVSIIFILLSALIGSSITKDLNPANSGDNLQGEQIYFSWSEPEYMPRHEECIDPNNGQDEGYIGYGIGYEPSLSIDSEGNLFVTAHKDLRWGGEGNPFAPVIGGNLDTWYACEDGEMTSWDYWASWFWISNDGGETWGHGENFEPTPGNLVNSAVGSVSGSGSECLGDEGDIAVDANDVVYYLDTTLEDNWWHKFTDGGNTYISPSVCERMQTMAADDRPWVSAQGDGIIHYLGNSGASPPECTADVGRYWYYHSESGGAPFSQCYAMPGGWSTISSQNNGPYVFVAQEDADSDSGTVQVRVSPEYGRGTGPGPSDGTWLEPVTVGPRTGNCPEGYPVVNNNEGGMVVVTWADCPNGNTGPWEMNVAVSYDNGTNWSNWNATPFDRGIAMYPFVSITEDNIVSISFYGLDFDQNNSQDGYVEGKKWYLYAGALRNPMENDTWDFKVVDPTPLHTVTSYEQSEGDTHALHDFFETVMSPDGDWIGIAYQENVGEHPFEENEEQRYIKFVRGDISSSHSIVESSSQAKVSKIPWFEPNQLIIASRM
ncbi:MAG: hypothetical protein HN794_07810 [Euryarchaeota archaeon]|nr:hypothetical protein [Euryarchaeota archaeon]MBT7460935.1 hypothetical protein [Euryarchaeota archaeon]